MKFIKCEICNSEISEEKCVFATCKKNINGEEYYFCSERQAEEFERKKKLKES